MRIYFGNTALLGRSIYFIKEFFMKNVLKTFGIIALVAIIGFSMAALSLTSCGGGGDDTGGNTGGNQPSGNPPAGTPVEGANLEAKLLWLKTNAQSNTTYTITISANESISEYDAPVVANGKLEYPGKNGITIILWGSGSARIISNYSSGSSFIVNDGVKLVLDNNITLQGASNNILPLVRILSGGELEMKAGSKITGAGHGAVGVDGGGGKFTMNGGTISGNTGTGVSVGGTFTMNAGEISGNTANFGGGVSLSSYSSTAISGPSFIMNGGKISGNTSSNGGGVYVSGGFSSGEQGGSFIMNGGEISGNTADSSGGGVYISGGIDGTKGSFTMKGGTISGNTAKGSGSSGLSVGGGGVCVGSAIFTMDNGIISGNKANNKGGGVYINGGTFRIANGTIYGSTAAKGQANTATNGAVLYSSYSTAERGTLSGTTWTSKGTLSTTDNTIIVENGVLQ